VQNSRQMLTEWGLCGFDTASEGAKRQDIETIRRGNV
jgi:hypothetical protein